MQDKINEDINTALKAGEKNKVETLKMVKSALQNASIENKGQLDEKEAIKVMQKEAKKRREAAEMYQEGGNKERAAAEMAESDIIETYLPEQMSNSDIEAIVDKVMAAGADNMGAIMGQVMAETKGQADGGTVSRIVKEKLA